MTLHYITVQNITLHYILHITLHISLHITLHYITYYITYYITLHYIILHVILHYITLHYICIYTLYILYIYVPLCVCVCCVYIYIIPSQQLEVTSVKVAKALRWSSPLGDSAAGSAAPGSTSQCATGPEGFSTTEALKWRPRPRGMGMQLLVDGVFNGV
jgi:hypothetical protein